MLLSTVIAVALGLTQPQSAGAAQIVAGDYSSQVGAYTHSVDSRGATHLKGQDRNGVPYELVMDRNGYVEANIGDRIVSFRVQEAG